MKNNLDKSELVILDVFEIVDKPVFKYKINVLDKFVILVSNNDVLQTGVSKCINKQVNERLELYVLTKDEKSTLKFPLTHKFHLKQFSKSYLFLNLTDNDLINLGFKEPQIIISKTKKLWIWTKKFHKVLLFALGGLIMFLTLTELLFQNYDYLKKYLNPKESSLKQASPTPNDNNISKIDSLSKK